MLDRSNHSFRAIRKNFRTYSGVGNERDWGTSPSQMGRMRYEDSSDRVSALPTAFRPTSSIKDPIDLTGNPRAFPAIVWTIACSSLCQRYSIEGRGDGTRLSSHVDFERPDHFRDVGRIRRSEDGDLDSLFLVVAHRLRDEEREMIGSRMPNSVTIPSISIRCLLPTGSRGEWTDQLRRNEIFSVDILRFRVVGEARKAIWDSRNKWGGN